MPASFVATARCACSSADLPLERRRDLLRGDRPRALGPVARECSSSAASIDSTSDPPSRAFFAESVICASALSIRNAGGTRPAPRAACIRPELAVELLRVRLQPREVRLGVRRVLDRMIAVEEARDVEIRADVLDDDVRRVAPAADGDVAVGEREALERGRVRAAHDLDAGARRRARGRFASNALTPLQVGADLCRRCAAVPAAERSASCDRSAARAPVSIPSDVAPSGPSFRRLSATSSSSLSASASPGVAGPLAAAGAPPPPQLDIRATPRSKPAPQSRHVGSSSGDHRAEQSIAAMKPHCGRASRSAQRRPGVHMVCERPR